MTDRLEVILPSLGVHEIKIRHSDGWMQKEWSYLSRLDNKADDQQTTLVQRLGQPKCSQGENRT